MPTLTYAFLLGDLLLQTLPILPSVTIVVIVFALMGVSIVLCRHSHSSVLKWASYALTAFLAGFIYSAWYAHAILSWVLPKSMEGVPTEITGTIASLPHHHFSQASFLLLTQNHAILSLTWPSPSKRLKVGDEWRLHVKLKRIHSTQNKGSFDFVQLALQSKFL